MLVQWNSANQSQATWEDEDEILKNFPARNLVEKVSLAGEGNVSKFGSNQQSIQQYIPVLICKGTRESERSEPKILGDYVRF